MRKSQHATDNVMDTMSVNIVREVRLSGILPATLETPAGVTGFVAVLIKAACHQSGVYR